MGVVVANKDFPIVEFVFNVQDYLILVKLFSLCTRTNDSNETHVGSALRW